MLRCQNKHNFNNNYFDSPEGNEGFEKDDPYPNYQHKISASILCDGLLDAPVAFAAPIAFECFDSLDVYDSNDNGNNGNCAKYDNSDNSDDTLDYDGQYNQYNDNSFQQQTSIGSMTTINANDQRNNIEKVSLLRNKIKYKWSYEDQAQPVQQQQQSLSDIIQGIFREEHQINPIQPKQPKVQINVNIKSIRDKISSKKKSHHQCSCCNKTFLRKKSLVTHMRVHFKHQQCDQQSPNLQTPKSLSNGNGYACPFCKRTFRRKESADTHLKSHL